MKKTNTNYVSTTLEQFLNESRNITLTRKYGSKEPVVVSSKAPIRNKVLQYVAENVKITKNALKKFMVSLNESNSNPASISMWMKRNEQYFLSESKNGVTTYKLSALGKKLVASVGLNEGCNCGTTKIIKKPASTVKNQKRINEAFNDDNKEEEWKDPKQRTHDFEDHGEEGIYDEMSEDTYDGAKKVIESIKARRVFEAVEEEEEEEEEEETPDEEAEETEETEETEESDDEEGEEEDEFGDAEDFEEDDDKVEITEFILSVDDAESAIAELAELGITAERVTDDVEEPDEADEFEELPAEGEEELPTEGEEDDEFGLGDLDDLGDIEGEEVAESVNEAGEDEEAIDDFADVEGEEAIDDFAEEPVDDFADVEGEEPIDDFAEEPVDDFGDAEGEDLPAEEFDGNQIKVTADNWPALKGWLESKGVDTKELFGGDIVEEGEDGDDIEEEIDFDSLENLEEYEDEGDASKPAGKKEDESDEDESDEDESDEDESDEDESDEDDKKPGGKKKWNFDK